MTTDAISYSAQLQFIELALDHHAEFFLDLTREMDGFVPLEVEAFNWLRNQMWSQMRPLNDHLDDSQLMAFIDKQVEHAASADQQHHKKFFDRFATHIVPIIILSHSLLEALINATIAIGLHHTGRVELFQFVESADLKKKFLIGPRFFCDTYRLETGHSTYGDLSQLVKLRNAWMHSKIELRGRGEVVALEGSGNQSLDMSKSGRGQIERFIELPCKLQKILSEQISDESLKWKIESLLRQPKR